MTTIKTADSKGRVTLGSRFANQTVIVRKVDATEVVVTIAEVVPKREMWLQRNRKANASVARGLKQARAGRFSRNPPDLD
jgi:hypothetical protein